MKPKMTMSSHTKENFEHWLNGWDSRIESFDDNSAKLVMKERMDFIYKTISKLLSDSDKKAMAKHPRNEKKAVEELFANQEKQWYKDLKKCENIATVMHFEIDKIFELKNRRSKEILRLKKELVEIKPKAETTTKPLRNIL